MNKKPITRAIFVLPVLIWLTSALPNQSVAAGHYRIGTLNESHHYRDNEKFNSSHDGFYVVYNRNVVGTYYNSESNQSLFYARNKPISETFSFSYGAALGYEFGLVPMIAVSAQFSIVKVTLMLDAAVIGLEFPLF